MTLLSPIRAATFVPPEPGGTDGATGSHPKGAGRVRQFVFLHLLERQLQMVLRRLDQAARCAGIARHVLQASGRHFHMVRAWLVILVRRVEHLRDLQSVTAWASTCN